MQKRIDIDDSTLKLLKRVSEELSQRPRSISLLEGAIHKAAKNAVEFEQYYVKLSDADEKRIAGLVEYGFGNRADFIATAVREKIEALLPELKERMEEEIRQKQKAFGIQV